MNLNLQISYYSIFKELKWGFTEILKKYITLVSEYNFWWINCSIYLWESENLFILNQYFFIASYSLQMSEEARLLLLWKYNIFNLLMWRVMKLGSWKYSIKLTSCILMRCTVEILQECCVLHSEFIYNVWIYEKSILFFLYIIRVTLSI